MNYLYGSGSYDWAQVFVQSFQDLWSGVIGFIPAFLGAVILFILGLIVAAVLGTLVEKLIAALKIDSLLTKVGVEPYLERAGLKLNAGKFLGKIIYWFVVLAFLLVVADILKFSAFVLFLQSVLNYIPSIIIAVLIMLATFVVANFLKSVIKASMMSARLHAGKMLGELTWWVVVIFGLFAALIELGIAEGLIMTVITALLAMLALAGGIAFGLGGKDHAGRILNKLGERLEK
ncbi:MAG: hypothetical protein A3I31_03070 [Candidatus Colwellbacteria bacterium RIFCSPLOWO2_02_FULL_44_20b]|uniref:Small-conductance mechanosensitive ion channel n=1 Tax=Candidatus Colwellbacteria bacterium RIFCSPLOWO2_02_FULL_44_20b TaxID=1797691 RepID=A0A1G1Z7Z7_9BACT|nr:MAG: hypothetical protein A3I31_03070 [Candidatus Colwellbacteria bacterium RIFCSPLOWO2_02_FULL_44_20b]